MKTRTLLFLNGWLLLASSACVFDYAQDCRDDGSCVFGGGGSGGDGGDGGGTPDGCVPSEESEPVDDSCGVFVSSGSTAADETGSKQAPYKTIAAAVAQGVGTIYLCGETFEESVQLPAGVDLFGGLDCNDSDAPWRYLSGTKSTIAGMPNVAALSISGDAASIVEDLIISAADATTPSASSVAVAVETATVTFNRCDLSSGDGAAGDDGETLAADPALAGTMGDAGVSAANNTTACMDNTMGFFGGAGGTKTCPLGAAPGEGGLGGTGTAVSAGGAGSPGGPNSGGGNGGPGQSGAPCQPGIGGDTNASLLGAPGMAGPGAIDESTLMEASYVGTNGTDGLSPGMPGKGAGGGGGARVCGGSFAGPSGGGGGSGGCGGRVGTGGRYGGSSFALLSRASTLVLHDCTLAVGNGGDGGDGGDGQAGGAGGPGGPGGTVAAATACGGGVGGAGGKGGPGGGGLGGHSVGIAFTGSMPTLTGGSAPAAPKLAGGGGLGGGGVSASNALPGDAAATKAF